MAEPRVHSLERVRHVLDGAVESRSEEGREYFARIMLSANLVCSCKANMMRDQRCVHLKALLDQLDAEELRRFILESQEVPT